MGGKGEGAGGKGKGLGLFGEFNLGRLFTTVKFRPVDQGLMPEETHTTHSSHPPPSPTHQTSPNTPTRPFPYNTFPPNYTQRREVFIEGINCIGRHGRYYLSRKENIELMEAVCVP